MKKNFIVLFVLLFSIAYSQSKKIFFETGINIGSEGAGINFSSQYFNPEKPIAGIGINLSGYLSYDGFKKPKGEDIYTNSPYYNIKSIQERRYGFSAGVRLLSNFGVGIEGGCLATFYSKWTIYDFSGTDYKYNWSNKVLKGYPYAKLLIFSRDNKFTVGFGINEIEKGNLYFGYKF